MNEAERLLRLEERYAHLQRHMTEQDKAMLELAEEVQRLKKGFTVLRAQQSSSSPDGGPIDPAAERPPHY